MSDTLRRLRQANEALRAEIAKREEARGQSERSHQRERVLNALLRISMEDIPLLLQLERALDEVLSIPWLPVLPQGAIFLAGEDPEVMELEVARGLSAAFQASCARVRAGRCLCGRAVASGRIQFASGIDHRHEIDYDGMQPHGHYCVPILSGQEAIGALVLYLDEGHRQDAEEQDFLRTVAHTLAGIIERKQVEQALQASEQQTRELYAQLEEHSRTLEDRVAARTREIQQRRQVAESLRGMLTVLNSDLPLDEILEHIVAEASRLLGSDTTAIYGLDRAEGTFAPRTIRGLAAEALSNRVFPSDLGRALGAGHPVAAPDLAVVSEETDLYPALACVADCCQALLAVPLTVKGEVYGGLVLYYSEPRPISEEEISLAVAFGDQAALAIENARLHEQVKEAAVKEERARLARELHDSVTQALFSMTLLAEAGHRLAGAGAQRRVQAYLERLGEMSHQSLKEMRLLLHELRPPALEQQGLVGALQQRLDAVEARAGVDARLLVEGTSRIARPVEEALYRIAEQALNNALQHAAATSVTVRVQGDRHRIVLEVVDDGQGFDPEVAGERGGQGLVGMRERVAGVGGELTVFSGPGQGTRVRVEVEMPEEGGSRGDTLG
jgi:signal transduction histidine kinase